MTATKLFAGLLLILFLGSFFTRANDDNRCASSDIERIDSCLIGKRLKEAIEILKLDTSQFFAFDEPPWVLRGIEIQQTDSCFIRLYVDRTFINKVEAPMPFHLNIIDKKIIGVTWKKPKKKLGKIIGFRISYFHDLEH